GADRRADDRVSGPIQCRSRRPHFRARTRWRLPRRHRRYEWRARIGALHELRGLAAARSGTSQRSARSRDHGARGRGRAERCPAARGDEDPAHRRGRADDHPRRACACAWRERAQRDRVLASRGRADRVYVERQVRAAEALAHFTDYRDPVAMTHILTRAAALLTLACAIATPAAAQQATVSDLAVPEGAVPVRLVGYGLVVGLDGTGDRALGSTGARHTVQSIVNLLRNFDIEVPAEMLRTRNVAAVLVTAELSPWLRAGGTFDVNVSSIGDATSLRGGVLWATPLVAGPGGPAYATAQGPLSISAGMTVSAHMRNENTARIPNGGLMRLDLPRADF